jgi:(E)-4-hydroxy-3-methylbut-2-enyl-diphosphate synthase
VEAGCEIVRVTTPSIGHAKAMAKIRAALRQRGCTVPLVADVHHNGIKIALEVAQHVDKVRINPGLFIFDKPDPNRQEFTPEEFAAIGQRIRETFEPLVTLLRDQNKALRIGVNHGSLAERMLFTYGDTPEGMVESAMEFVRICHELDFHNIVISMKASRAPVMLAAYRLMADTMDKEGFNYPLHLGVTEAGDGDYGPDQKHRRHRHPAGRWVGRHPPGLPDGGPREGNPRLLLDSSIPGSAQDHGGVRRLPQLRSHPVQSRGGAA